MRIWEDTKGLTMRNLDKLLQAMGQTPVPELASLDNAVLSTFAERQSDSRATKRMLSAAAVVALGVGYAGGSLMPSPASAAEHRLVISETALAPSTLLDFL